MKLAPASPASGLFVTLALLTGCIAAGNQAAPVPDPGQPAAAKATGGALLYVVDNGANTVSYLSYPKGKTLGTLTGFGSVNGSCVDAKGDVFITDSHNSELDEFAHGGSTILKRLKDPQDYLLGCSVDPVTGNLAVATQPRNSSPGGVAIFTHAKGKPKDFEGSSVYLPGRCTYDDNGNLFVDGSNGHAQFALAELPVKSKAFVTITLDESMSLPAACIGTEATSRWTIRVRVIKARRYIASRSRAVRERPFRRSCWAARVTSTIFGSTAASSSGPTRG